MAPRVARSEEMKKAMPSPPVEPAFWLAMTKENLAAKDAVALPRSATGRLQITVPALDDGTPVSRVSPTEPFRRKASPSSVRSEKESVAESMLTVLFFPGGDGAEEAGGTRDAASSSRRRSGAKRRRRRSAAIGGGGGAGFGS